MSPDAFRPWRRRSTGAAAAAPILGLVPTSPGDSEAIEALLEALPRLGPLGFLRWPPRRRGDGGGWRPPPRLSLAHPWLAALSGWAFSVEAEARIDCFGLSERLIVRDRDGWPLLACELIPLTDFCEWERIFAALSGRAERSPAAPRALLPPVIRLARPRPECAIGAAERVDLGRRLELRLRWLGASPQA